MPMYPSGFNILGNNVRDAVIAASNTFLPAGARLGFLGDSITDHGKTRNGLVTPTAYHESLGFQVWFARYTGGNIIVHPQTSSCKSGMTAAFLNGAHVHRLANCGQVDAVHIMMGHNGIDLNNVVAPEIAAIKASRDKLVAAGIKVIISAVLPDANWPAGSAKELSRQQLNAASAALHDGVTTVYYDPSSAVTGSTSSITPLPGMYNADGIHPAAQGYEAIGKYFAGVVAPLQAPATSEVLGYVDGLYNSSTNPYGNRIVNPTFNAGTGGTIVSGATGALPQYYSSALAAGTGALGAAYSFDATGITFTGTGTGGGASASLLVPSGTGIITTGMVNLQLYTIEADIEWSGCQNIRGFEVVAALGGADVRECRVTTTDNTFIPASGSAKVRIPVTRIASAGASFEIRVVSASSAVATAYTIKAKNFKAYQLPALKSLIHDNLQSIRTWRVRTAAGGSVGGTTVGYAKLELLDALGNDLTLAAYDNISASSTGTGGATTNAFDTDPATLWRSGTTLATVDAWLRDGEEVPVNIRGIAVTVANDSTYATESPTSLILEYTYDAVTWFVRQTWNPTGWAQGERRVFNV